MEQYNKVGFGARIGCLLIGWNSHILKECGESSRRALRKYVSAIIILSIIWGVIGYCFAERYMGVESILGKCFTSLTFITIITCVERYIILSGKLSKLAILFRFGIAIIMAILGSAIIDQIIFKNDVEFAMNGVRTEIINKEVEKRNIQIDKELNSLSMDIDSLNKVNDGLRRSIAENPVNKVVTYENSRKYVGENEDGTSKFVDEVKSHTHIIPNTLNAQVNANDSTIRRYDSRKIYLQNLKLETQNIVRNEFEKKEVGFLQELNILYDIITKDGIALAFYITMFCFFLLLELLVVTSKGSDGDCDYDLTVKHQQRIKELTLKRMEQELIGK